MMFASIFISLLLNVNGNWIQSSTTLPNADYQRAIGNYRDVIYLIGGGFKNDQLVEYNITQNIITELSPLTECYEYGTGQYYAQVQNQLFMIDPDGGNKLSVFNLETKSCTNSWRQILIPISVSFWGCLAATNDYIFITGGMNSNNDILDSFQILDLSSNIWINNQGANMNRHIRGHSCVFHPSNNVLYAIGGAMENGVHSDRIEYISVGNVAQLSTYSWQFLSATLTSEAAYTRSVVYNNNIYIIGGLWQANGNTYYLDTVHIIDINTQTVSLAPKLEYPVYGTSAIIVNDVIYAFGGYNAYLYLGTWQYLDLTIANTTATAEPTVEPTDLREEYITVPAAVIESNMNTGKVVGIVFGVLVVISVIVLLSYFLCRRSNTSQSKKDTARIEQQEIAQIQPGLYPSAPEEDITNQLTENEDKMKVLLEKWNLKEYYSAFHATGWDDVLMWTDLIKYEYEAELNSIFKLKTGHKAKFVKYVKEEFNIDGSGEAEGLGAGNLGGEGDAITLQ